MGAGRLAVMLVTFFGLAVFFIFVAARSNTPGMTLLYSKLSTIDATEIAAKLDNTHIPYKLSADGTQVMVPQKDVGKARILLAEDGLPSEGSVGYEIFDQKQAFGTTRFVENIDAQRALEGALARTINSIDDVRSSRIQLVLPQHELFSNNETPASASVFLNLRNTASITPEQIHAIQHLIAAAVPRLKAENVAIIDQDGNLLAQGEGSNSDDYSADSNASLTEKYDMHMARQIEDMVGRIVGYGNVRANVTAEMDFDQISSNSESYDPNGQVVRSTQSDTSSNIDNSSSQNANGAVSVSTNLPGLPNNGAANGKSALPASKNDTDHEITNYDISKTVQTTRHATGTIKKLSVAVLVDGKYVPDTSVTKPKNAPADWQPPKKYVPLSKTAISQITELVKSAVGYNADRGDIVQVVNMQFAQEATPLPPKNTSEFMGFQKSDLLSMAETLALSIVAVLVILLVLRPLALHMIESAPRIGASAGAADEMTGLLPAGAVPPQLAAPGGPAADDLENMIDMSQVEGKVKASSVQKISELVQNHPAETVSVIRSWMSQEN